MAEKNKSKLELAMEKLNKQNGIGSVMYLSTENTRSEEHTSELQSHHDLVCRLLLEKKKKKNTTPTRHNK